ncbi:MAG: patatin-like phospholipase family protein [Solirubrobacteraceae bacterium]
MSDLRLRPDVLVLAAGGVVGEAWMTGWLRGVSEVLGIDFREVEVFVGTSAGSIVCASLAAGREPRPADVAKGPSAARPESAAPASVPAARALVGAVARGLGALSAPLAGPALVAGAPGGAIARRTILSRVPEGRRSLSSLRREVDGWGARFDGRLRICTVDVASGRRVVFGAPGAPEASVGEAVEASCAVPGIFRPVTIGDRVHVDGGAWSLTNLDVAPVGRDTHVLCLSVAGGRVDTSPAGLMRAAARPAVALEAALLRRRGARVTVVGPDQEAAAALGANLLDPRASGGALQHGYRQGLAADGGRRRSAERRDL